MDSSIILAIASIPMEFAGEITSGTVNLAAIF